MKIYYYDLHYQSALSLFNRRQILLFEKYVTATTLSTLEDQLCAHLHTLAETPPQITTISPANIFVALSTRWLTRDTKANQNLIQWLEQNENIINGVIAAATLCQPKGLSDYLQNMYHDKPSLRSTIISICHQMQYDLPFAILNHAATSANKELQSIVLKYAADNPQINLDFFQFYYQALSIPSIPDDSSWHCLAPAIWGGLLRSDPAALIALRFAIEQTINTDFQGEILYLAALTGHPDFIEPLQSYAESNKELGFYLLGIYGCSEIFPFLLKNLRDLKFVNYAAKTWHWLTAQSLDMIPLFTSHQDNNIHQGERPNIEVAEHFYQEQKKFHQKDRFYQGNSIHPLWLLQAIENSAGQSQHDLLALLSLNQKQSLPLRRQSWQLHKSILLRQMICEHTNYS